MCIGCRDDVDRYTLEFLLNSVDSDGILSLSLVVDEGGVGGNVNPLGGRKKKKNNLRNFSKKFPKTRFADRHSKTKLFH